MMKTDRHSAILSMLEECDELSVGEIARRLGRISVVTVRRDVAELAEQGRLVRHHGGASRPGVATTRPLDNEAADMPFEFDAIDAFVLPPIEGRGAETLRVLAARRGIPVLAESSPREFGSYLGPDNFAVGRELGNRAGRAFRGQMPYANLLLVSIEQLPNTRARVEGFDQGFRETFDGKVRSWRVDSRGSYRTAYDGCLDVLDVQSDIQIIFGVNDHAVLAGLDATERRGVPALAYSVGGEGGLLFDTLSGGGRLRACAALFPTVVGTLAIDALAGVFAGEGLAETVHTPHAILTPDNLGQYYEKVEQTWRLRPGMLAEFTGRDPGDIAQAGPAAGMQIGFAPHYPAHDWYRNLQQAMQVRCAAYGILLRVAPPQAGIAREIAAIRREIARRAVADIAAGETIAVNAGPMQDALCESLMTRHDLTIITNSLDLFEQLSGNSGLKVLLTSGELHAEGRCLVGPSVGALFETLRADRCLLSVDGLTVRFGASARGEREALAARRFAEAARHVIVLADHSLVGVDANHRITPADNLEQVITDAGSMPKDRLALSEVGVQVFVAANDTTHARDAAPRVQTPAAVPT